MPFKSNRKFKRKYNRIFKKDPVAANMFLLLCELANKKGEVMTDENELAKLFSARFNHPKEYAL